MWISHRLAETNARRANKVNENCARGLQTNDFVKHLVMSVEALLASSYEHTCYSIHIIVGNNTPADTHTHKCTHETRFSKPANWFIVNVHKLIWTVETVTHSGIYGPSMANPTITTIKRNDVHILTKCSRFLFIYIKATDLVGIKQMVGLKRWKENPSQRPPFVHYTPSK